MYKIEELESRSSYIAPVFVVLIVLGIPVVVVLGSALYWYYVIRGARRR